MPHFGEWRNFLPIPDVNFSITIYESRGGELIQICRYADGIQSFIRLSSDIPPRPAEYQGPNSIRRSRANVERCYNPDRVYLTQYGCVVPFEARRISAEIMRAHGLRGMRGTNRL